ncbi:Protein kinase-like domain containing protein [Lactarius tabidus]
MMLQGASVVRFANSKLDAYKERKNFVFVAIYIDSSRKADRYLLYQDENAKILPHHPDNVYRKLRTFNLEKANERTRFALELYNFSSTWHDDEDTRKQVDKLRAVVDNISANLNHFTTSRSKRSATDTTGGDGRPKTKSETGDTGDAVGQLEDSGYEVVPGVLETDGGTWELIDKPPPHVRIVYRRSDLNKTKYIAKHLREGSNELAIYEYLGSIPSPSPHIISLIEVVPSTTREWLILPRLYLIRNQFLDENGAAGRVQLGWGLIKGLGYLHEHKLAHRDIKPSNLVRDSNYNLKIIDFDTAIQVEDENTEIDGYCGTEGWTAPEVGKQDGPTLTYSPIKADRWSCGRVILGHIMVGVTVGKGVHHLLMLANWMMAKDPQQRPSLLESLAPPLTVVHDRWQHRAEKENMRPPVPKKRRLEPQSADGKSLLITS